MPIAIRKLSAEESAKFFRPRGQAQDLGDYMDALSELEPSDVAELSADGVTTRALKRRLTGAANQLGIKLKYAKDTAGGVRFRVEQAATGKKRGRPRKTGGSSSRLMTLGVG
jgi:hypothetical protein